MYQYPTIRHITFNYSILFIFLINYYRHGRVGLSVSYPVFVYVRGCLCQNQMNFFQVKIHMYVCSLILETNIQMKGNNFQVENYIS
jgi:hypothetical protein